MTNDDWRLSQMDIVTHDCPAGNDKDYCWWARDAQGIELAKVCDECESIKLGRYRPEILTGYDQSDVDEPIEPD